MAWFDCQNIILSRVIYQNISILSTRTWCFSKLLLEFASFKFILTFCPPKLWSSGKRATFDVWVKRTLQVWNLPHTKAWYLWRMVEGQAHHPPSFEPCTTVFRGFLGYKKRFILTFYRSSIVLSLCLAYNRRIYRSTYNLKSKSVRTITCPHSVFS